MSIQINIGDHRSHVAGYVAVPGSKLGQLKWARRRARRIAREMPSANAYFRGLPDGRSLSDILRDRSIWINYGPSLRVYGEAVESGRELAIGPSAFRIGRWTVLATLIHELAHINGAAGGHAAELALIHTGLGKRSEHTTGRDDPRTPYDPGISG